MKTKDLFLLLVLCICFSCSTDDSLNPSGSFSTSVFVTVNGSDGKPIPGAQLTIGDQNAVTEEDGTYFFTDITLTGDDYLQAEKTGFFNGSRRFAAQEASTQYVRITLMEQKEIGSFNSAQSTTLNIDNKSTLIFPADAVTRSNGSAYAGTVHVMASPIYTDDPQLSTMMPGALTGEDENGALVALGSFGMLAVELQADNGEALEVASGKTVEIQFAVSDHQLDKAPATIPLWHFDESKGQWVEEGEATLQGNQYIAQVPHFSFWNWDVPQELIELQLEVLYKDGLPAQNMTVCITIRSIDDTRCAPTNASGIISGPVLANEDMIVTIKSDCGTPILTTAIGPFSENVQLNPLVIDPVADEYATISGTALQCDGTPVRSGFAKIYARGTNYILPISSDGYFEGGYMYCAGDVVTLYIYDVANSLVSPPRTVSFERNMDVGHIKACNQLEEFVRYKVQGFYPEYVYYLPEMQSYHATNYSTISTLDSIGVKGKLEFGFDGTSPGEYTGYPLHGNQINLPNGQKAYINQMTIRIEEFGPVNEMVRGTFSGTINVGGNGAGGNGDSNFSGSFAVKNQ